VRATVDHGLRHATECNHTATHLLQAALRSRIGVHVRQEGSYVGPDKLRFDFSHAGKLSAEELQDVEDMVNEWVLAAYPVRALTTTLDEARSLGAMALFGEKYGEIVRMVEVGDGSFSRELCGGTHVRSTAEIAAFKITSESSSAANVRRIEALTGPACVALLRAHDHAVVDAAGELRVTPEGVPDEVRALRAKVKSLEKASKAGGGSADGGAVDFDSLLAAAESVDGAAVLVSSTAWVAGGGLLDVAERLKAKLGDQAAVVLGAASEGKVDLVASVTPALVARGVRAGEVVKLAASAVGGGGGGKDTRARAGGKDVAALPDAIAAAREAIQSVLAG
jgi:alanyl-tRNA synthetase